MPPADTPSDVPQGAVHDPGLSRTAAEAAWRAVTSSLAGTPHVRISRDGGRTYPAKHARPLPADPPQQPATVPVYDAGPATGRMLALDLDPARSDVGRQAAELSQLLERLGALYVADVAPSRGRHLYVLFSSPLPWLELRDLVRAIALRYPAVDPGPHSSLGGQISPPEMLEVSGRLNPDCEHHQGDMRTLRLGWLFDAVFVHDAVDYMTCETDLRRAVGTARVHCRPGGLAVFVPDYTAETFAESSDHGGSDGIDGRAARYLDWSWDPDPADTWVLTEYAFVLRDADGSVQFAHETHRTGVFSRNLWLGILADTGFDADALIEQTSEERRARELFVGRRPILPGER